jgi:hypothetical protein
MYSGTWIFRSASPICLSATKYSHILSCHGGNDVCGLFFGEDGYGRINGGTRVLELAADIWEAALGHGAR